MWSLAHIPYKPLEHNNCDLSVVTCIVCSEEWRKIALFLYLILYRCIPDPILCHAGNWRYSHILLGVGDWSATEERCHWCVESSVTLPRWYWYQQRCRVFQCRSVLQYHYCLVSLLLRPGLTIEIITVVAMKITVFWDVTPCSLIYIYLCFGETCYFLLAS